MRWRPCCLRSADFSLGQAGWCTAPNTACSKPTARSRIAETLKLASEQRPVNVTFRTHADGVKLSIGLKSKYPDDMTIILQNDFEQLNIKDDRFEVLLRLMGNRERLSVPFNAIKAFWDKSDLKCSDG